MLAWGSFSGLVWTDFCGMSGLSTTMEVYFFLSKNKTRHLYQNHWVGIFVVLSVSFPFVGMCCLLQRRQLVDIKFKIPNQKLLEPWQERRCVRHTHVCTCEG